MMVTSPVVESALKTTDLVVFPGKYHVFGTPSYKKDLDERYLAWFERYVKCVEVSAITES